METMLWEYRSLSIPLGVMLAVAILCILGRWGYRLYTGSDPADHDGGFRWGKVLAVAAVALLIEAALLRATGVRGPTVAGKIYSQLSHSKGITR